MTTQGNVSKTHHRVLILGGGTGGIITASLLRRAGQTDVAIVEPSDRHFYQPLWTLVGAGEVDRTTTARSEARLVPKGVRWIRDRVAEISPDSRQVRTESGLRIGYDFLVVAVGAQLNWNAIPGFEEGIKKGNVTSNYDYDLAPRTWDLLRNFRGGTALFHMPGTPIKCPGAPQKIMYLAADYFRRKGLARQSHILYGSATGTIYGAREYAVVLERVLERYGIDARFQHELIEIRAERNEAVFQLKNEPAKGKLTIPYDILHAVPPQSAPDCVRQSPLADPRKPEQGWVKVDKFTLQNPDFSEVFALGDVAGSPNAKTGAAASRQAPVVAANVLAAIEGRAPQGVYDGYIACPIVTGYGRMLLCELDYSGKPSPRIPGIDTFRERYDMWLLKKYGLPWLYWNVLLRGRKAPFVGRRPAWLKEQPQEQLAAR
jgi:sulfide:quinone oxidoreductase